MGLFRRGNKDAASVRASELVEMANPLERFIARTIRCIPRLTVMPDDPATKSFEGSVSHIEAQCRAMNDDPDYLDRASERLELVVEAFAEKQRASMQESVDALQYGLVKIRAAMQDAMEAGSDLTQSVSRSSDRLATLNKVTSYEQLIQAIKEETSRLTEAANSFKHQRQTLESVYEQELESMYQRLQSAQQAAFHDSLTGLPNRRALSSHISKIFEEVARGKMYSLALVDLDGFKGTNDALGHAAGDAVLQIIAKWLQDEFGRSAFIARLGGDEFVVVTKSGPSELAHKFHDMDDRLLQQPIRVNGLPVQVGLSAGVISLNMYHDLTSALQNADQKMYAQKQIRRIKRAA